MSAAHGEGRGVWQIGSRAAICTLVVLNVLAAPRASFPYLWFGSVEQHQRLKAGQMPDRQSTARDYVFFVALLSAGLAMGAAMAHSLELPNKIAMAKEDYFIVQRIYRGWNQLGYLLAVELFSMIAAAVLSRREPRVLWPTVVAIVSVLSAQGIFWVYTYPANAVTENWTTVPSDWETLRARWEYSHAAGAGLQVLALSALIIAVLRRVPRASLAQSA